MRVFYLDTDNSLFIKVYGFVRYLPVLLLGVVQHQDLVSRVDGTFIAYNINIRTSMLTRIKLNFGLLTMATKTTTTKIITLITVLLITEFSLKNLLL